jgi:cadmium resistance protein CadD (predicted permease)
MGKPEDEIEKKLMQLELSMKNDDDKTPVVHKDPDGRLITADSLDQRYKEKINQEKFAEADMYMLGGLAMVAGGLMYLFFHMRVGTFWPQHGFGFLMLPLFIGIGMLFYNYKSKLAQYVTAGGVALILFTLLSQLALIFPSVSMIEFILMIVPMTAGIAFMAKSRTKRKEIEDKLRLEDKQKSDEPNRDP